MYNRRGGRGNAIPNKPATKRFTNHTVKYHRAAHVMSRLLTVAKGPTLATRATDRGVIEVKTPGETTKR